MITINGKVISESGNCNNIVVSNGKVIVDGNDLTPSDNEKVISITVNGQVGNMSVEDCQKIRIVGGVGNVSNRNGDIEIEGDVSGDVSNLNGDISCGAVKGGVKTVNGTIKHK